jgi:predicted PurR-regulated permease PerM
MTTNTIHPSKIYQFILIGVILLLAWVLWKQLSFMFPSPLGAIALYILLKDPMLFMIKKWKMKDWVASVLLMLATLLIIIIPTFFLIRMVIFRVEPFLSTPDFFTQVFNEMNTFLHDELGLAIITKESMMKISGQVTQFAKEILSGTFRQVAILIFMYLLLFFIMVNGRKLEVFLRRNLPFSHENRGKVLDEVTRMVRSNAITIPLVALLQGSVAMIGYFIFGLNEALLLGVLTIISSMIPMTGALLVYLPVVIYTLATGSIGAGIGLGLWCFILVGSVDNVARFMLQKKLAGVHPIITILGVIVGTKLFGLIGLIFGPLTITLFIVLLKVYFNEFGHLSTPRRPSVQK